MSLFVNDVMSKIIISKEILYNIIRIRLLQDMHYIKWL